MASVLSNPVPPAAAAAARAWAPASCTCALAIVAGTGGGGGAEGALGERKAKIRYIPKGKPRDTESMVYITVSRQAKQPKKAQE